MSFEYSIEKTGSSATVTAVGALEHTAEVLAYISQLVKELSESTVKGIILDHTQLFGEVPIAWMYHLAEHLQNEIKEIREKRWAILGNSERLDELDFFALTIRNRGFVVRPFDSREKARQWVEE